MAGGGGGAGQEQATGPGRAQCAARRREEEVGLVLIGSGGRRRRNVACFKSFGRAWTAIWVIYNESLFKKKDFHCGPGETVPGSLLCRPAASLRREDCGHCREAGPEEERGARLVLQSAAETKAHEVCRATLTSYDGKQWNRCVGRR